MNELTIIRQNGGAYIDSRQVAEYIGKRHDHLLRDIGKYSDVIAKSTHPNFGVSDFFVRSSYFDSTGRELLCYLISKMGAEVIANKLIGEKGILFTLAYVTKFNAMERAEMEKKAVTPRLQVFNAAVRNVLGGLAYTHSSPRYVTEFLRGAYAPFGILVAPNGDNDNTWTASEIALVHNVYSASGRPHGHAVSAIIGKLGVEPGHIEIAPYGLVGISVRYDYAVCQAVGDWLAANNYPRDIPHLGFAYHICYERQLSLFDDEDDGWFGDEE